MKDELAQREKESPIEFRGVSTTVSVQYTDPGSTYTLDYNPKRDLFTGVYYQATLKKGFEIIFVRQQ